MIEAYATSAGLMGTLDLDKHLAIKTILASAAMLAGFLADVPVVLAAHGPGSLHTCFQKN